MNTNVLMVFPRFNPHSFWSLKATCKANGASAVMPPLGLMTVAAAGPLLLHRPAPSLANLCPDRRDGATSN
jgi:hypothetical protein